MSAAAIKLPLLRGSAPHRQGGMALIIVLWLIVLLGVMAAGHARNAHTDTVLAGRQVDFARSRALAEAGINHMILELLADTGERQPRVDGSISTLAILGGEVVIAARDATGLVDLNAAGADLLDTTLRACRADEQQASELVDAILDWRDGDNLAHLNGVEDADYRAAGLAWTSRDAAFESIDELKYLLGMRQELFDCLAPVLTVHSGRPGIKLEYAPPLLVAALNDGASEVTTGDSSAPTPGSGPRNGTYHIYASAMGSAGAVAAIEAVVNISAASQYPFTILDWREPPRPEFPPRAGGQE